MTEYLVLILYFIAINTVTFVTYWLDKRASRNGGWRIVESMLHTLALLGGSPAALLAQKTLRHKTRKRSFQLRFWLVVVMQAIAILWWILTYSYTK